VHIFTNVEVFRGGCQRSCRLCMTRKDDDVSLCTQTDTNTWNDEQTERPIS